jgi:hypothetical protein
MTVGGLIHNLTIFADFYEQATAEIDREEPITKPRAIGNRDVNTDLMQRIFRATPAIDLVRTYVLAHYGADLTIGTARRLLGDLIRRCSFAVEAAETLTLEDAMDRLESAVEQKKSAPPDPEAVKPLSPARHSPDFRSVHWYGTDYTFNEAQAAIVAVLWEAWENGTPDVGHRTLLDKAKVAYDRLPDVFKVKGESHPAWGTMIQSNIGSKGVARLCPPPISS